MCRLLYIYFFHTAPGTYSPEKVNLDKGPQYSLTGKGTAPKPDDIPGMFWYFLERWFRYPWWLLSLDTCYHSAWHVQSRESKFGQGTAVQFDRKRNTGKIEWQSRWETFGYHKSLFSRYTFLGRIVACEERI